MIKTERKGQEKRKGQDRAERSRQKRKVKA